MEYGELCRYLLWWREGVGLGDVVRLLRLRPSAAVPLFARVICVNFDV